MTNIDNVAEAKNPGTGNAPEKDNLALYVDTQIMRMLGLRFEVTDGIIKVWPADVVPDETNWLVGERFSQNLDASLDIIAALKVEVEFFESAGYHWAIVRFGEEGELETQEAPSKTMAGAFAAFSALYGRRGHKS